MEVNKHLSGVNVQDTPTSVDFTDSMEALTDVINNLFVLPHDRDKIKMVPPTVHPNSGVVEILSDTISKTLNKFRSLELRIADLECKLYGWTKRLHTNIHIREFIEKVHATENRTVGLEDG